MIKVKCVSKYQFKLNIVVLQRYPGINFRVGQLDEYIGDWLFYLVSVEFESSVFYNAPPLKQLKLWQRGGGEGYVRCARCTHTHIHLHECKTHTIIILMFFNENENNDVKIIPFNIAHHIAIAISVKLIAIRSFLKIVQPYNEVVTEIFL